jgi:hypothetical protein
LGSVDSWRLVELVEHEFLVFLNFEHVRADVCTSILDFASLRPDFISLTADPFFKLLRLLLEDLACDLFGFKLFLQLLLFLLVSLGYCGLELVQETFHHGAFIQ